MEKIFIFSNRVARDLVRNDYKVIDIAENQRDKTKTVFVFLDTEDLRQYLKKEWNIDLHSESGIPK